MRKAIAIPVVLLVLVAFGVSGRLLYRYFAAAGDEETGPRRVERTNEGSQEEENPSPPPPEEEASPPLEEETVAEEAEEEPPPGLPSAHTGRGFEELQKGEVGEARDFFLQHVTLYPLDPQGHFGLGVVHRVEEAFVESVEEFAKTLLLDPAHIQAKLQLAEMLTFQMKEDFESAERLYQDILQQVPEERSALNGLASVYLSTGRVDEAIQTWEQLRSDLPDQTALTKNLAQAYLLKAQQEDPLGGSGQEWITKARELDPEISLEGTSP